MTKETKAERILREASEQSLYIKEQKATYIHRMMQILQDAQEEGFILTVRGNVFIVHDQNDSDESYRINVDYDQESDTCLDNLRWATDRKLQVREESNRKYLAKRAALDKLTKEEKNLLGL